MISPYLNSFAKAFCFPTGTHAVRAKVKVEDDPVLRQILWGWKNGDDIFLVDLVPGVGLISREDVTVPPPPHVEVDAERFVGLVLTSDEGDVMSWLYPLSRREDADENEGICLGAGGPFSIILRMGQGSRQGFKKVVFVYEDVNIVFTYFDLGYGFKLGHDREVGEGVFYVEYGGMVRFVRRCWGEGIVEIVTPWPQGVVGIRTTWATTNHRTWVKIVPTSF